LRVTDLTKHFDGIRAVDRVSFEITAHEILGLIGPNGAGKTTLFNCLSGVIKPDGGSVELADTSGALRPVILRPHRVVRQGIARTFQDIRLFDSMTVLEHVLTGTNCRQPIRFVEPFLVTPKVLAREEDNRIFALALLQYVGLRCPDRLASSLTLAEQRRVGVARALATRPQLLLLDEPAAGLNEREKEDFARLLRRIRDDLHVTILLIEHDMNVLMDVSDRVLVMNEGRLIAEGSPDEVRANPRVQEVYLGVG